MNSARSKCGSVVKRFIGLFLVFVWVSPAFADDASIESIRRLATTCMRVAGHKHAKFVVIDPRTAQRLEVNLTLADLRQIAQSGTITRNGIEFEAVRPVLINPENFRRIEEAERDQVLFNYLEAFHPIQERLGDLNARFALGEAPTESDFRLALQLMRDLQRRVDDAASLALERRPAGHLLTMIHSYSPQEFAGIHQQIEVFSSNVFERLYDKLEREENTEAEINMAIPQEIFRLRIFLGNLRSSRNIRILP